MKEINNTSTLDSHNDLMAKLPLYELNAGAINLLTVIMANLYDKENSEVTFTANQLLMITGMKDKKRLYSYIEEIAQVLYNLDLKYVDEEPYKFSVGSRKVIKRLRLFIEYSFDREYRSDFELTVKVNDSFLFFFNKLEKNFFNVAYNNVKLLTKAPSKILFYNMMRYKGTGKIIMDEREFAILLGASETELETRNYKRNIETAIEEIETKMKTKINVSRKKTLDKNSILTIDFNPKDLKNKE
ncbi:hypothetical protein BBW65_05795 [Helicobacter enhydrae]|uniref:Initiator Rep protein WH1 domain-containing protein n=1 Tax=Helicobacter enhydrae TaxID=222136 RepID=A0A1B1U6L7_9HELI|nr:replication initiation protein [Helicobacter enhydrae]ANV98342.1 hypothetical protein BBW65_05795 [Helicobacter enhydrae]